MSILPILIAPNPILRRKAALVSVVDNSIRELLKDMEETMIAENGIGLAAPQIGISKQILIMDVPTNISVDGEEIEGLEAYPNFFKMINPKISWASEQIATCQEGCLSVPGQFAPIKRPEKVRVKYLNENGESCETEFSHLQAACVQHEMDHLDGKLFVDYLSSIKRDMFIRKAQKIAQNR
jgi:peptide deformylase